MPDGLGDQKTQYVEFRVEVLDEHHVQAIRPSKSKLPGAVRLDPLTEKTLDVFDTQLADGRIARRDELEVIGAHLFRTLFDDTVAQAFRDDWADARSKPGVIMRLKLEFRPAAAKLARLPWEYLFATEDTESRGRFIAGVQQLVLTRFVPMERNEADNARGPDQRLRILVVVSAPDSGRDPSRRPGDPTISDLGTIDYEPVTKEIKKLEESDPARFLVDRLNAPNPRSLTEKVRDFRPDVLHFIGHGYLTDKAWWLAMVDERDPTTALWADDATVTECLVDWPPKLVFLQSCKGARTESHDFFRGMALRMVESSVGAVVAMQYEVENFVANEFAKQFYQALGQGEPVDRAVQRARVDLGRYINPGQAFSSRAFGSPVVFVQTADGIVVAAAKVGGAAGTAGTGDGAGQEQSADLLSLVAALPRAPSACPWCGRNSLLGGENFCIACRSPVALCPRCGEWVRDGWPTADRPAPAPGAAPYGAVPGSPPSGFASASQAASVPMARTGSGFYCYKCNYSGPESGDTAAWSGRSAPPEPFTPTRGERRLA